MLGFFHQYKRDDASKDASDVEWANLGPETEEEW